MAVPLMPSCALRRVAMATRARMQAQQLTVSLRREIKNVKVNRKFRDLPAGLARASGHFSLNHTFVVTCPCVKQEDRSAALPLSVSLFAFRRDAKTDVRFSFSRLRLLAGAAGGGQRSPCCCSRSNLGKTFVREPEQAVWRRAPA